MSSIPPYPPSTIPPSDYYTPSPSPTLDIQHLAGTGSSISLVWLVVAVVLVMVGCLILARRYHRKSADILRKREDERRANANN